MDKKICLLDTDIGDDIDDAFALALLLSNEQVDLKAVTTVYKNTKLRAKQATQLIKTFGKNIPVYYGEGMPLIGKITPFLNEQGDLITNIPCQYDESMNDEVQGGAVDKIIELSYEYANELVILAIGPLTNIAAAIKKDKNIANKINKVILMGGWYTNYCPEWNILCDPLAAEIVFSSGIDVYACGLDVTLQCTLDGELLKDVFSDKKETNKKLYTYFQRWVNYFHFEKSVMHDPVAVTCLTDDICTFKKMFVKVSFASDKYGAVSVNEKNTDGYYPINVATSVDKNKFYSLVRNRLL